MGFKTLTDCFLKVQFKRLSIIQYLFSTAYADSKFFPVSLIVLLGRISYFISALLERYMYTFLLGWKLRVSSNLYLLLLA